MHVAESKDKYSDVFILFSNFTFNSIKIINKITTTFMLIAIHNYINYFFWY